jgi:hypothetical protein
LTAIVLPRGLGLVDLRRVFLFADFFFFAMSLPFKPPETGSLSELLMDQGRTRGSRRRLDVS